MDTILRGLRGIGLVVNVKTVLVCILAVVATWASLRLGLVADYPLTIISTAVIFPIVFSIGHAYKRRENALDDYGVIKAHGRALYFAARDWLADDHPERLKQIEVAMERLLTACRDMFKGSREEVRENEKEICNNN